jgi:RNA polymerase sigma-70 factor (ECF subfamily)
MEFDEASRLIEGLLEDWGPSLARQAYRLTGCREASDDLVQEAFLALYQELRKGEQIENPRAWTLTVVRHHAAKRLRRMAARGEQLEAGSALDQVPAREMEPERGFDELADMLRVLSSREQEVLLLRLDSMKYREIAECLGIDDSSVATHLARAIRKLQAEVRARMAGQSMGKVNEVPKTLQ